MIIGGTDRGAASALPLALPRLPVCWVGEKVDIADKTVSPKPNRGVCDRQVHMLTGIPNQGRVNWAVRRDEIAARQDGRSALRGSCGGRKGFGVPVTGSVSFDREGARRGGGSRGSRGGFQVTLARSIERAREW